MGPTGGAGMPTIASSASRGGQANNSGEFGDVDDLEPERGEDRAQKIKEKNRRACTNHTANVAARAGCAEEKGQKRHPSGEGRGGGGLDGLSSKAKTVLMILQSLDDACRQCRCVQQRVATVADG